MAISEVPEAARAVSHTFCSGTVWELCFHTALRGSLLINLKWKHLLVSRTSNYLVLPHRQWQWAALKPNWVLAEQTSACGRQQSCPHLFPSTVLWARLSLCILFLYPSYFLRWVCLSPLQITTICEQSITNCFLSRSSLDCKHFNPNFLRNWITKTTPWP